MKATPKTLSIDASVEEYDKLRLESKIIKERMDMLSKQIKEYAMKNGVQDDKGSYYCENDLYQFGSQAKKSVSFEDEKAIQFFKSRKLYGAIKTVEVIDDKAVETYISRGDITISDLESITKTNVSYAIMLKAKEAMPVVEEVPVQLAASVKPRSPFRKK